MKSILSLLAAGAVLTSAASHASSGEFDVLTYNVAGLIQIVSPVNPKQNTIKISPKLNDYDIVLVQEDFQYHRDLVTHIDHPYQTTPKGLGMLFNDGLNRFSRYPFVDFERHDWDKCHGVFDAANDCLAPKGFSMARHRLAPGIDVDIYNLHADAGGASGDKAAREDNFAQLLRAIATYSVGQAVIVVGDTNSSFASANEVRRLLDIGFKDGWIETENGGRVPDIGESGGAIDKILYRSSSAVSLDLLTFTNPRETFSDENGVPLSDHDPRYARFAYSPGENFTLHTRVGGQGGGFFNHLDQAYSPRLEKIALRSGNRIDHISLHYQSGEILRQGGNGGQYQEMSLAENEYVQALTLCADQYAGGQRLFYLSLNTNQGNQLTGGRYQGECQDYVFADGTQFYGFWGRSGAEIDQLAPISMHTRYTDVKGISRLKDVGFRSAHNQFVVAEQKGGTQVNANRDAKGSWEHFNLIGLDQECIRDQSQVAINTQTGYFLTASSNGTLNATGQHIGPSQTFSLINHSRQGCVEKGDSISLRSHNGSYLVAESNGDANANRSNIGAWERFVLE